MILMLMDQGRAQKKLHHAHMVKKEKTICLNSPLSCIQNLTTGQQDVWSLGAGAK